MPWLGQRKPWSNRKWDGHHYEESRSKQVQPQLEPEVKLLPKLSIWGKLKRFLRNLYLKWRNSL